VAKILEFLGLLSGFIGSILLLSYPPPSKIPSFTDDGKNRVLCISTSNPNPNEAKEKVSKAKYFTKIGFALLSFSFFCQLIALLLH